jgi:enoyl-CoA hydratase/carnithine racemase
MRRLDATRKSRECVPPDRAVVACDIVLPMAYKHLDLARDGHVATVTLNRPEKLNALSLELMDEIRICAEAFRADAQTRAVIFAGAGPHFSAGADLNDPARAALREEPMLVRRRATHLGQRMIRALLEIEQITIAAIHGACVGGAACIATALDVRIGARGCFVSYPEIDLGMNLSWFGLPLCVRLVGPARAKRMVILGKREPAETLAAWGFLDDVVEPEALMARAREVAAEYASKPPMMAQMIKRSVNAISGALDQALMHMDTDQFLLAQTTGDHTEAVKAFREKRPPVFEGK